MKFLPMLISLLFLSKPADVYHWDGWVVGIDREQVLVSWSAQSIHWPPIVVIEFWPSYGVPTLGIALLRCPHACGDFNGDDTVDLLDFATFASCFGADVPDDACDDVAWSCSDMNDDWMVDLFDFATFTGCLSLEER